MINSIDESPGGSTDNPRLSSEEPFVGTDRYLELLGEEASAIKTTLDSAEVNESNLSKVVQDNEAKNALVLAAAALMAFRKIMRRK